MKTRVNARGWGVLSGTRLSIWNDHMSAKDSRSLARSIDSRGETWNACRDPPRHVHHLADLVGSDCPAEWRVLGLDVADFDGTVTALDYSPIDANLGNTGW